jgi:hypothetical protein
MRNLKDTVCAYSVVYWSLVYTVLLIMLSVQHDVCSVQYTNYLCDALLLLLQGRVEAVLNFQTISEFVPIVKAIQQHTQALMAVSEYSSSCDTIDKVRT